jgi:hypothetical protein
MAVVIQSKEDANNIANNAIGNTNMFTINTNSSSYPLPAEHRGNTSVIPNSTIFFFLSLTFFVTINIKFEFIENHHYLGTESCISRFYRIIFN